MGRIKKAAGPKQEATVSAALSEFVSTAVKTPLFQLPSQLRSYPRAWPFPRGDLYHWIPLLNRFDTILEQFNAEYGLHTGPQTQPFERRLLMRGVADDAHIPKASVTSLDELESMGFGIEGDRELVEVILEFSRVLLENCGNRSLYSSSERLNDLLNTTSTSLLSCTLRLATRLAQRYHASRQRGTSGMQHVNNALLASLYNINLDKLQKLALPFLKSNPPASVASVPNPAVQTLKGKDKAIPSNPRRVNSSLPMLDGDMVSMVKDSTASKGSSRDTAVDETGHSAPGTAWHNLGSVCLTYYVTQPGSSDDSRRHETSGGGTVTSPQAPTTPSPARRNSGFGTHQTSRPSRLSNSEDMGVSPTSPAINKPEEATIGGIKALEISYSKIASTPLHELMKATLPDIPQEYHYDLLSRVRIAHALSNSFETRREMLAIRILAITNLAYVYPETTFQQKVLQQDSDEPRRMQLTYQLAELVHPPGNGDSGIPRPLQTLALGALEALAKQKSKAPDVCTALSINVNHGVLLYVTRKAVTEMATETYDTDGSDGDDWREALFSLLSTLSTSTPRAGESMVTAGLVQILVEVLTLRTDKAERNHTKVINLFDSLVYQVRDAFQTLANAKGLDILADLTAYEVESALQRAEKGQGMPLEYRTQVLDYQIPYFQQQTLRWLFKFIYHMMQHGGANFDRLLRNLIDSPQLLSALRVVLSNAKVFGSNVWSGAVNILSSFIHNEPTSYAVIAEAGLSKGLLEAVTMKEIKVPERPAEDAEADQVGSTETTSNVETVKPTDYKETDALMDRCSRSITDERIRQRFKNLSSRTQPLAQGVLPATDAIATIPTAFGAICLNSAGMELFKASDALDSFFGVFESAEHVKCMASEGDLPVVLGRTFDELIRHHPQLKIPVLSSVMIMIARVGVLCTSKAGNNGSGAKLWVEGKDGQVFVAGGNEALLGLFDQQWTGAERDHANNHDDVNMEMDSVEGPSSSDAVGITKLSLTTPESLEGESDNEIPSVSTYILVAVRFLAGFFENPSHCAAFVEAGGVQSVIDFATLPTLPYDFNNQPASPELARVVHMMAEQKPHLVLPPLIRQTQAAVDRLEPLTSLQDGSALLAPLTERGNLDIPHQSREMRELVEANGTLYVKALVAVHTLSSILCETFSQPVFHSRSSHTPFSQVNLADMYAALVKSLGRLHSACVWEEIVLQKSIPDSWRVATRIKGYGIGSQEADEILGLLHHAQGNSEAAEVAIERTEPDAPGDSALVQLYPSDPPGNLAKDSNLTTNRDQKTAQFRNVKTLRYLLSQVPPSITPFFQGLGKLLIAKRRPDGYQRQNAYMVADALAEATIDQLRFQATANPYLIQDRYSYWIVALTSLSQFLVEGPLERPHAQCLTLVLQSFKNQGGLDAIKDVLMTFFNEVKSSGGAGEESLPKDVSRRLATAYGGIKIILTLYSQITNPKYIVEASQTAVMSNDRDREKADYFSPAQFLVELRMAVLPVVRSIWESDFVDKASSSIVKCLIEILRTVLEGEHEHGAFKRSEKVPVRAKAVPRPFTFHSDRVSTLKDKGYDEELTREALYRCNNNLSAAEEYCKAHKDHALRNPIPNNETQNSPPQSHSPPGRRDSEVTLPGVANGTESAHAREVQTLTAPGAHLAGTVQHTEVEEAGGDEAPTDLSPPPPAPGVPVETNSAEGDELLPMSIDNLLNLIELPRVDELGVGTATSPNNAIQSSDHTNDIEVIKPPEVVTVDDLDSERSDIRTCLIDRCLDVLNVHSDVTFELGDLITAAVAKAADPASMRREIGETLVQSLISLQLDEDFRPEGKKLAAYANLLALVIQDRDFYEAALDELKDNFATLLGFIKVFPDQTAEASSPWIGQILLTIEKMLGEDAQPQQIKWTPPTSDEPTSASPIAELEDPVIPFDEKSQLFDAVVEVLPRIGKDESLALSVVRVLVILTRHRQLAEKLGEKRNMQRLFVMVKQLAGMTNERLQSALMLVLRHVIEDEDTIRQIMRSEIVASFKTRPSRQTDTTGYARQMYHLVLRAPELFVEITNEKLKLQRFDSSQRPQVLSLKTEAGVESLAARPPLEDTMATQAALVPLPQSTDANTKSQPEQQSTEMADRAKSLELRMPVVEHPDGVIHYLLCELLSYKDVEDREPLSNAQGITKGPKASTQVDVHMASSHTTPSPTSPAPTSPTESQEIKKDDFKADQHPVYIYRCFLLQCLTELLSSYNRTKIEFINFSRKADPQAVTPSKPRSGVLNYLLNSLIPLSTLEHEESLSFRKKNATSSWAMSVVVALCSKTGEQGDEKPREIADNVDEPDLLFVRKFVLEHALKAYKDANASSEVLDVKYARMLSIADLFNQMLTSRPQHGGTPTNVEVNAAPQKEIARIMYEKNFISALTSSIADIDLNFPGSKRVVKYILRPLKQLARAAITLSETSSITTSSGHTDEDDISTASSVSDMDDDREETPDLFRNSTLGMFEPSREEDSSSDSSEGDEEMYDDEYGDEMEYEEDMPGDSGDVVSDEDEDIDGTGHMEGLPGDVGMDVEVVIDEEEDDDPTDDEEDEDDEDLEDMEDGEEIEIVTDIHGDEENESLAEAEEDEWQSEIEEGDGYEGADDVEQDLDQDPDRLDIVHAIEGEAQGVLERLERGDLEMDMEAEGYMDDVIHDEEEDDEDEEDTEDQDLMYEPDFEVNFDTYFDPGEEPGMPNMPWDWDADEPVPPLPRGHHHHHHHHRLPSPWTIFPGGPPDRGIGIPTYRSHRPVGNTRGTDDGTNPLLQRNNRNGAGPSIGRAGRSGTGAYLALSDWVHAMEPGNPGRGILPADSPVSFMNNIISAIGQGGPFGPLGHRHGLHLHVAGASRDLLPRELQAMLGLRRSQPDTARPSRDDPAQAVHFAPTGTTIRWQEEARLLYGNSYVEKTQRLVNSLLRVLVPPAIEEERIRKEKAVEELRKQKEEREKKLEEERIAKEKAEKEAQEKSEQEEREAAEAAEAAARTQSEGQAQTGEASEEPILEEAMEGVECTHPESPPPPSPEATEALAAEDRTNGPESSEPAARVRTTIRGRELDITGMDIDPEYLDALPEELREEVLMHQLAEQRSQAAAAGEEPTDISREFLEALPPDIREELLQQEAQDRRRREREEHRRRAAANAGTPATRGEEMDPATFLASLDPTLRQAVLMEQDEDVLAQLPQELAAEARALGGDRRLHQFMEMPRMNRSHGLDRPDRGGTQVNKKPQRKQIVQMLDKAGVATLLRLMFIPQQGSARQCLNSILHDVCENRQNRAEVVSLLLSILQDGSADINAVDRSFQQLSLRAKQAAPQKTPQPKRTLTGSTPPQANNEMTPLMVVQQCLSALVFLTQYNPHIPSFFLTEHETSSGLKHKTTRKGKGKEGKAQKYALNALLSLLDRKLIMESSNCMELLSTLLNSVTHPLTMLLKKDKEKAGDLLGPEEPDADPAPEGTATAQPANNTIQLTAAPAAQTEDINMAEGAPLAVVATTAEPQVVEPSDEHPTGGITSSPSDPKPELGKEATEEDKRRRQRTLLPPVVPEYNLRLVINILAARECSAKTFRDTLSTINNLSAIPEAKHVFGKELIKQAQELVESILSDLDDLVAQIKGAGVASDIQGMALARFSLASSDQAKLLRVLTALDYLFDPKRNPRLLSSASSTTDTQDEGSEAPDNLLTTLYENSTFGPLWTKLSECLSTIRSRENMLNVATILLPLIEALMVVCKNTTLKEAPLVKAQKEFSVTSPPPESRMESIFFNFTEEHRKILNDLVRHNPKLMSGTFSLLVKNPKVLEFDNKRNYFSRRLHSRGTEARHPQPPLQLSVRRDQVFLDSFKSLYFKSGDEMKYGKLSIRFHGEEGVDAGGVTREWFQVLSRQMFNPDYALFTPVASDRTTFHPNRLSSVNPEHFMFFKFIGRVIGKALYEGRVLDCHFSRAVYKRILGKTVSIKDMETLDLDYYKSLVWMLENDITDIITENFSLETEAFGETQIIDLIENGRNIPVTEENKQEYVQLVVEYRLTGSVREQLENFLKGFHDIVPAELISIFNEQELELLISGLPDIDVDDWKNNTEYHNYSASSSQIQWFWRAVRSFDKEERAKLLQFVTGTSKVPLNGFKELEGMNGFSRFNIHRDYGNKDRLPSSHTCFNQIDLPEYESYEALRQQVHTAITAGSEYFGFA